jgi:hypothetical protein
MEVLEPLLAEAAVDMSAWQVCRWVLLVRGSRAVLACCPSAATCTLDQAMCSTPATLHINSNSNTGLDQGVKAKVCQQRAEVDGVLQLLAAWDW